MPFNQMADSVQAELMAVKEELPDTPFNSVTEGVPVEQKALKKELPDTFNQMVKGVKVEQMDAIKAYKGPHSNCVKIEVEREDFSATVLDVPHAAMRGPEGASADTMFVSIEPSPLLPSSSASVIISEHDVGQRLDAPGVREKAGRITLTSSQRGIKRPRQRHRSDTRPALDITADERAYFNVQTRLGQPVLDPVMPLMPMLYDVLQAQQHVLELKARKFELEIRNLQNNQPK